jgi:hypothetical protein
MVRRALAGFLALIGLGGRASADRAIQHINPHDVRFSMSTLAKDEAPLEPFRGKVGPQDLIFHEDEWRQIEFFPKERLGEIERMLTELKTFEQAHRTSAGWNEIYSRALAPIPVLTGGGALKSLEHMLGCKAAAAPILFYGAGTIMGRVASGFSLPLGGRVSLYGIRDSKGIAVLGAGLNAPADDTVLIRAFAKLSARDHLILVDWRAERVMISTSRDGQVSVFSP